MTLGIYMMIKKNKQKMIFYSDKIINEIIDNSQLDEIVDKIDAFRRDIEMIFTYFTYPTIGLEYIQNLLQFKSNKVAFYCFDDVFDIRNCPSCMIYAKDSQSYYIMIICTQKRFRGAGYATMLLDGFIDFYNLKGTLAELLSPF
mgnify:CR=1 FL=1